MSVTIETAPLARAMKHAAAVVEGRNTIPICGNVLLHAEGDTLELVTTNLDVEFRQSLPLTEGGELSTTVDARRLYALAQAAGNGSQLKLEMDGQQLAVKNGRSRWKMPVLPASDFPNMPFDGDPVELVLAGAQLSSMFGRVMWSVSTEQTRYYLQGPLLHAEEGSMALAATDGSTLMRCVSSVKYPDDAPEIILMPKFCRLAETLAAEAESVKLEWDDAKIRATIGDIALTAKVIDGTFPQYRRVIPPLSDGPVSVDPEPLRAAIRKSMVLSDDKTNCIKVERAADKLLLSTVSPGNGESQSEQPAECSEGFAAGFNAKFLDAMLDAIGGDSVVIHQADERAPARFQRVVDDGSLGIVMPMRI